MTMTTQQRPCRICGTTGNEITASETPCALWGERPWMPEGDYTDIRCRACGGHYVDSDVTEAYLDELQATPIPENVDRATCEDNAAGEMHLDYGSAWGAFGNHVKQDGPTPNGIELHAEGAAFSRTLWGGASTVHEGTIETAPWGDGTFQYITSFETLEHVFDPIRILSHMRRMVWRDGVVAISVPSSHYFEFTFWLYRKSPISGFMFRHFPGHMTWCVLCHNHITTPSPRSARLRMEKAGLRVSGRIVWYATFKKIIFAPSIFLVAVKDEG